MNKLENLKERKEQIEDQIKRAWFKHKLTREPTQYQQDFPDAGKWNVLGHNCSDIIEEYKALGGKITELEMIEMDKKIKEIWEK